MNTTDYFSFLNQSVTPFHTSEAVISKLSDAGFILLKENEKWKLDSGQSYYLCRDNSAVIAFTVGDTPIARHGFRITAAHTDSPAIKIKFSCFSKNTDSIPVEIYGSPIIYSWFDRKLAIAGRISARNRTFLVNYPDIGLLIPSLAIHLQKNRDIGFSPDLHKHLQLMADDKSENHSVYDKLIQLIRNRTNISEDFSADLFLYDPHPAQTAGINDTFYMGQGLDNKVGCYTNLLGLIEAKSSHVNKTMVSFFADAEEIGSKTGGGADSNFLRDTLQRILLASNGYDQQDWHIAIANSSCISNDAAHAQHPNHTDVNDEFFQPQINSGPVIKFHAKQKYSTTSHTGQLIIEICNQLGMNYQQYVQRADIPGGSTIGPFIQAFTQIPVVDIGIPLLAMHSIRETAGINDTHDMILLIKTYYLGQ